MSSPSVGIYTVFNEGWGQFDTQRMVQLGKSFDPSRLWDAASGWIDPQDRTAFGDFNNKGPWMYHYKGYVRPLSLSLERNKVSRTLLSGLHKAVQEQW